MKIPTLIGLTVIISLIGSLWFLYSNQKNQVKNPGFTVSDLEALNISDTTATLVWQTNVPALGEVVYGESENLNQTAMDNRDQENQPTPRLTHFTTIKNLKPNTKYFYKTKNNEEITGTSLSFQTANIKSETDLNFSFLKPIKGTVLNTNLNPVDESLIFLEIKGAQKIASFSSTAGNFVVPLKLVLTDNLSQVFNIPDGTNAKLTIKKGAIESNISIIISDSTVNLPPLTLGANLDLSNYKQPQIQTITIGQNKKINFDYNADNKVNSLDLAVLRSKAGSGSTLSPEDIVKFDINGDGLVNQEDVAEFSKSVL